MEYFLFELVNKPCEKKTINYCGTKQNSLCRSSLQNSQHFKSKFLIYFQVDNARCYWMKIWNILKYLYVIFVCRPNDIYSTKIVWVLQRHVLISNKDAFWVGIIEIAMGCNEHVDNDLKWTHGQKESAMSARLLFKKTDEPNEHS